MKTQSSDTHPAAVQLGVAHLLKRSLEDAGVKIDASA
jgi:hypothetical protein